MTNFHTLDPVRDWSRIEDVEAELEEVRKTLRRFEHLETVLLRIREVVLARPLYGKGS